jgi:leucyl aminopeptidase
MSIMFASHEFSKTVFSRFASKIDIWVIPVFEDLSIPHLDGETASFCHEVLKQEPFPLKHGETLLLLHPAPLPKARLLFVGAGKSQDFSLESLKQWIKKAYSGFKKYERIGICPPNLPAFSTGKIIAESILAASYHFSRYHSEPEKRSYLKTVSVFSDEANATQSGLTQGDVVGQAVNYVRDLGNTPSNDLIPQDLVKEAQRLSKNSKKVSLTVLNEKDLLKKKMFGLLSVGQGSVHPPRMILIQYKGGKKTDPHLAFVGKGITFDAGGISIKPAENMDAMKMDMLGAGTLLGLLQAVIELELPLNLSFTLAAAENMPSGSAYKPGDILKTYSGTTIEVLNTDAEGRVALSDALTYAQERFKPETLIDLATLTGACITALGHEYTAAITNHQPTCNALLEAGKQALDEAWPLPLNDNFRKMVKSHIADLANIGPKGQAGTIMGAAFLEHFIQKDVAWVHLDIAGTAMGKEATGRPLPLLIQYLLNRVTHHA